MPVRVYGRSSVEKFYSPLKAVKDNDVGAQEIETDDIRI